MSSARRNDGGFVLVATLWALAALAVLAAYIDGVVASDLRRASEARRSLQAELDRRSTEATLVYLLATGRMNHRALILEQEQRFSNSLPEGEYLPEHGDGEILVTGVPYAAGRRHPLRHPGRGRPRIGQRPPLRSPWRPCSSTRASPPSDTKRILARVEDYIDSDHALTLNGAERYDYLERGEAPPLNWIMASPQELRRVLGVEEDPLPRTVATAAPSAHDAPGVHLQLQHHAARDPGRPARPRRAEECGGCSRIGRAARCGASRGLRC